MNADSRKRRQRALKRRLSTLVSLLRRVLVQELR